MKRFLAFVCAIVLQSSVAFASLEIENAFEDTGEGKNGFHGGLIVSLWDSKNDEEFSRFILCAGEKKLIDLSA
ncbi:MAG: hypothetical protein GY915_07360, partial [bacterium]|nr:hypothetical protein [bacterium]